MVVNSIVRYVTSFIGALIHTIAGLAVLLALPVLYLIMAFLWPSTLGMPINQYLIGGASTGGIAYLRTETPLSITILALLLVGLIALFAAGRRAGHMFYAVGKTTGTHTASTAPDTTTGATSESGPDVYLRQFRRSTLFLGVFQVGLLVLGLIAQLVVQGASTPTGIAGVILGIFAIIPNLLGGPVIFGLNALLFIGVWYGLREEATEALAAGIILWGLMGVGGLITMVENTSGAGLVIAGAYGVYYGLRARQTTELRYVESGLPT